MIKHVFWIIGVSLVLLSGINPPLFALDIGSNDFSIGIEATFVISQDDEVEGYVLTVPYLKHSYEIEFSDNTTLTLDSHVDATLEKVSIDEETANALNVEIEPAMECLLPEELSLTELVPFSFSNTKSGEKDGERENAFELASRTELSYSTMEEDLHGISSWDKFQKGVTLTGVYDQQLYSEEDGEKAEDLDNSVGIEAEYSYFHEEMFLMITPSVSLFKHLNTNVDESLEIEGMVEIMKDINEFLTVGVEIGMNSVKEAPDADFESELDLGGKAILSTFEDLEISTRFGYSRDVSDSDANPAYSVILAAEYDIF